MGQDIIAICGRREFSRAKISVLMQCDVKVADVSENVDRNAVGSALPRLLDDVVP